MHHAFLKPVITLFLAAFPCWVLLRWMIRARKRQDWQLVQELRLLLFFSYLVVLAAVTVLPVEFSRYNNLHTRGINLLPVKHTWQEVRAMFLVNNQVMTFHAMENIVGNILLFMPMGFLLPLLFGAMQSFPKVLLTGLLVSVLIESTQWISRLLGIYRFVDIDDVILNTLGTAIGYWIAAAWIRMGSIPASAK